MSSRIMYKNEDNSVGILTPTAEALTFATVINIAEKDVPHNLPYKIIDSSELPTRTYRDAWEWDDAIVPDGFGGESNEFDAELLAIYNGGA